MYKKIRTRTKDKLELEYLRLKTAIFYAQKFLKETPYIKDVMLSLTPLL